MKLSWPTTGVGKILELAKDSEKRKIEHIFNALIGYFSVFRKLLCCGVLGFWLRQKKPLEVKALGYCTCQDKKEKLRLEWDSNI